MELRARLRDVIFHLTATRVTLRSGKITGVYTQICNSFYVYSTDVLQTDERRKNQCSCGLYPTSGEKWIGVWMGDELMNE